MRKMGTLIPKGGVRPRPGGFLCHRYPETPRFREGGGASV